METSIALFDLVLCLSEAVDLVSPLVADHHKRVANIAWSLCNEIGLSRDVTKSLVLAGAMHDVGGLSYKDRIDALSFETDDPDGHSIMGYLLLGTFGPFKGIADIVRFHHVHWEDGCGSEVDGHQVMMESHLLHLADRISVLIDPHRDILPQVEGIRAAIREKSGDMFVPSLVEAFESLGEKEFFWLEAVSPHILADLNRRMDWDTIHLQDAEFYELTHLIRRVIDFRSVYTAYHSAGVAATAEILGRLCGFDEQDCRFLLAAGHFHDLGKLAVSAETLEKTGKLTAEEFSVMRGHPYHTNRILEPVSAMDRIRSWGALHHERLDGSGYPFHLAGEDISLGARILAVADVFVALTENRPYRQSFRSVEALQDIQKMSKDGKLDGDLVSLLERNFEEVKSTRMAAQEQASGEYRRFREQGNLLVGRQ